MFCINRIVRVYNSLTKLLKTVYIRGYIDGDVDSCKDTGDLQRSTWTGELEKGPDHL